MTTILLVLLLRPAILFAGALLGLAGVAVAACAAADEKNPMDEALDALPPLEPVVSMAELRERFEAEYRAAHGGMSAEEHFRSLLRAQERRKKAQA